MFMSFSLFGISRSVSMAERNRVEEANRSAPSKTIDQLYKHEFDEDPNRTTIAERNPLKDDMKEDESYSHHNNSDTKEYQMITQFIGHNMGVSCVGAYKDFIITGSYDMSIKVWDIKSGKYLRTFDDGHTDWVTSLQVFVVHKKVYVASTSYDGTCLIFDLLSGTKVSTLTGGHTWNNGQLDRVRAVAVYVPKNRGPDSGDNVPIVVTGGEDNMVVAWKFNGPLPEPWRKFDGDFGDYVSSLTIYDCPTRGPLVLAGSENNNASMWTLLTGEKIADFKDGHLPTYGILAVAVYVPFADKEAREGDSDPLVITGSTDKTCAVWDLAGVKLRTLDCGDRVNGLTLLVRQNRPTLLFTACASGSIQVRVICMMYIIHAYILFN